MNSFFDLLHLPQDLSPDFQQFWEEHVESQTIPKGTLLQQKGERSPKGYLVKKGLLRSYAIDEKGKEHIFMFAPSGWIIGSIESQVYETPAALYIDAIETSEVEVINLQGIDFLEKFPTAMINGELKRLMRRVVVLQERVIMLMSASAKDRYEAFLQTYPNIVQRVPQKMIASYLGITPEALSKIRGDISRAK